jgi:hypothetical protein
MKYRITITMYETSTAVYDIEADTEELAEMQAKHMMSDDIDKQNWDYDCELSIQETIASAELAWRMWIIVQLLDPSYRKSAFESVERVVREMSGDIVKTGGFGDVEVMATFPHRKYKSVEKAVAAALNTIPVERTIVTANDPYVLHERTVGLTMELYRRQDEHVIGPGTTLFSQN